MTRLVRASPRRAPLLVLAVTLATVVGACGRDADDATRAPRSQHRATTIRVPRDHRTIQAAVDTARPGDLVLVSPGTYRESVTIETPRVAVRGTDRNRVVLDGHDRLENGVMALADGVAVENLTVHHYRSNGVFFTGDYGRGAPLVGYRAAYVTAYDNGLYGVYAFNARGGSIDHTYASGHPDSGIYIGRCNPCDAVVSDVTAELNAVGYEGTSAGGNLAIVHSTFRRNRVGMTAGSSTREGRAPQHGVSVVGNVVADNADPGAARATDGFGVGIAVSGGQGNTIERNRIGGNPAAGILLLRQEGFGATGNVVRDNALSGNGIDLVDAVAAAPANCFAGNSFATSSPPGIEDALPCPPAGTLPDGGRPAVVEAPPAPDWRTIPAPPPQAQMPHAATAPARPPTGRPPAVDLAAITLPPEDP
jgi:parallel beta-helix repeat protein